MAQVTAAMVKELREKTGAGMMDCKKALGEVDGNMEEAIEFLRKKGLAAAAKKSGRIAAEGAVVASLKDNKSGVILEVNSETDFVAKNDGFKDFTQELADLIIEKNPADVDAFMAVQAANGQTVEEYLNTMVAKIGEKLTLRRFTKLDGNNVSTYIHMGGKIGVVVNLEGGNEELAKDICLHIAASNPKYLDESFVDADYIEKEKEIFAAKLAEQGKPEKMIPNIIKGQVSKLLKEVCLVSQPFVKNPDVTIAQLLADNGAKIVTYTRYEMGEGLEKKQENFAEEVAKQLQK
ncbi:translation elongation factor Ts [Denitrovibrio acetiphilus DSM 12809]|uniref:Elongation factor Ts n=1 Tax=Denitrovibrio acetiphilus (strain DSM 12809 / NBRC 114555 / N2460) TaxID=522772 RepID=D4H4G2_DENA2|nr:translation elongation factor Ts [Denitrovibrio acetiphilus]ADD69291.1 translation elongation factor Ts [Denitrovibrio acetiphilus DSM 12809]